MLGRCLVHALRGDMGEDRIRYFVFVCGRWRWRPTKTMRARGFRLITFGREATSADKARAIGLNDEWDRVRTGRADEASTERVYPHGSIGDGYQRALKLRAAGRKANGVEQTPEQEARDDWPRAWKWLEIFAECDPSTVQPEHFLAIDPKSGEASGLVPEIEAKVSITERHRAVKVWRALWKKMAAMNYCVLAADPSMSFSNTAPAPRQLVWRHWEVYKLVQRAWREGKRGLAAAIAVTWDTMLSPVDVRQLTSGRMQRDLGGAIFFLDRAKTGRAAAGTLSRYSQAILTAYIAGLGIELHDTAPLFRTPGSAPGPKGGRRWAPQRYTKDKLEKDFAEIRELVFGPAETRTMADMRRSGHVEGDAGGASPSDASSKMANTISVSNRLRKTYNPVNVVSVRRFDEARKLGRKQLKQEQTPTKSVIGRPGKVS
jgi:hypothetical protein